MRELNSLLELLGEEATLALVEHHGGTRVKAWKKMPDEHPLRSLLGDEAMARLIKYFGGSEISVPMARRWRIERFLDRGMNPKEIARRAACTESLVYAVKRGVQKRPAGQMALVLE